MTALTRTARLLDHSIIPATLAALTAMILDRPDATLVLFAALGYAACGLLVNLADRAARETAGPQIPLAADPFAPADDEDTDTFATRVGDHDTEWAKELAFWAARDAHWAARGYKRVACKDCDDDFYVPNDDPGPYEKSEHHGICLANGS